MIACLAPNGQNVFRGGGPAARVLVGTRDGIRILERGDRGSSWKAAGVQLEGSHISCTMYEPKHRGLFAGVHGGGIHFSADEGRTWQPRSRGVTFEHVYTLGYADPPYGTVLYAGTEPAALFKSHDYGQSWEELATMRGVPGTDQWTFPPPPHIGHTKTLAFDPRNQEAIYVGVEQGALLKSTDAGASWRELDRFSKPDDAVYKDVHRVLLRPSNPDEIFMTGGMGLYHSLDAGETWEHLTRRDFRIGYPDQLFFSPLDDRVLIMAGSAQSPGSWRRSHDADATIMRSPDGGKTWQPLGSGLPEHIRGNMEAMSMYVWQEGARLTFSLFGGTTDGDVFFSEDEGNGWQLIASGLPPVSKAGHYRNLVAAA
jgi:photosystem II stability/assembly factor-like uncharacterized protein